MRTEITFIGDPMCSWCYGFGPELEQLRRRWADRAEFRLLVGGLRRDQQPIDAAMRETLLHHWHAVHDRTGRPFNFASLDVPLRYDTEPACRAVVAARSLGGDALAFEFFELAQQAFYATGSDPHDPYTWAGLAERCGIDAERLLAAFESDELRTRTRQDFADAAELGVAGYPAIVAQCGSRRRYLTLGFVEFDVLNDRLEHFVARGDQHEICL